MMRFNRSTPSITGRPKSKGREALDAVLFLGAAGVVGWSGVGDLEDGRIVAKYGIDIGVADKPMLFWGLMGVHLLVFVACLVICFMSARALFKSGSKGAKA